MRKLAALFPLPTPRLLVFLLGSAVLFALAWIAPIWQAPAAALTLGVLLVAVLDWLRTPSPRAIVVVRAVEDRLALGVGNPAAVILTNRSRYGLRVLVRDEPPDGFQLTAIGERRITPPLEGVASVDVPRAPLDTLLLPALGEAVLHYELRPLRRGLYTFGNVTLRYTTILGLLQRQTTILLAREVKVYPNLREVRRYDLALRRNRAQEAGLRTTRAYGAGTEFERLRDYHPDDEYRRINWLATARRGKPITTDYQVERSQTVLLMLDVGRLMSAPIDALSKLDHAVNACLLVAYVCLQRGDNVGLLAFADRVTLYLAPRGGKGQFNAMLEALYDVAPQQTESDYRAAFAFAEQRTRRRALVIVFTELVDDTASRVLSAMLVHLSRRHVVVCATMRDPILDAMLGLRADNSAAVYRRAVALTLTTLRASTLEMLTARGIISIDVAADRLTPGIIDAYLDIKARGRL